MSAGAPAPERAPLLERISDHLNPILVKEVRQAVRGRYFRVSYGITLTIALLLSIGMLIGYAADEARGGLGGDAGPAFFVAMFCCLAVAGFFWVPFFAFFSMGNEWDENTFDLLVLSNLRPRRVVWGKLWSAGVQALLYFCTFGPFLVFAFLLNGVDLREIVVLLPLAFLFSLCLSMVALSLSTLSWHKFARMSLMTLTAAGLITITGMAFGLIGSMRFWARSGELMEAAFGIASVSVAVALLAAEVAVIRLAHAEENRSTGMRVVMLGWLLILLGWLDVSQASGPDDEYTMVGFLTFVLVTLVPCIFFITEPEALGRRVRQHVSARRVLAFLSIPFLPGGGRGLLLTLLLWGAYWLVAPWTYFRHGGRMGTVEVDEYLGILAFALYLFLFLGIPSAGMARRSHRLRSRNIARAMVPLLAVFAFVLPTLLLFFGGERSVAILQHPGDLPWVAWTFSEPKHTWPPWLGGWGLALAGLALLVLAWNLPRMWRGAREVMAASAERRARESPAQPALEALPEEAGDAATGS